MFELNPVPEFCEHESCGVQMSMPWSMTYHPSKLEKSPPQTISVVFTILKNNQVQVIHAELVLQRTFSLYQSKQKDYVRMYIWTYACRDGTTYMLIFQSMKHVLLCYFKDSMGKQISPVNLMANLRYQFCQCHQIVPVDFFV